MSAPPETCLSSAPLTREQFEARLNTRRLGRVAGCPNEVWDTLDSTSTRAAQLAQLGAPEGVIVAARQQTAGRGRLKRPWISPSDAGLYMSFLLRPTIALAEMPLISLAAGVACCRAIAACCQVAVALKWVNDLVVEGRKVGGILAEMGNHISNDRFQESPTAVILGIGINLRLSRDTIPEGLRDRIDWLERVSGCNIDDNQLAAAVANELESMYDLVLSRQGAEVVNEWKKLSVTLGEQIRATCGNMVLEGTATDVSPTGALLVATRLGQVHTLTGGEISIRRQDGSYA